jgi:hypothetical protein
MSERVFNMFCINNDYYMKCINNTNYKKIGEGLCLSLFLIIPKLIKFSKFHKFLTEEDMNLFGYFSQKKEMITNLFHNNKARRTFYEIPGSGGSGNNGKNSITLNSNGEI